MLLLDGHVSHFSKAFIERAIELDIVVLCYPPHSTHIFQGLDVVLFSRAKAEWTKSRDKWEFETGEGVTKESFLEVFGEAYTAAFTPANNKKAFEKTGVHPFNRNILQPKDLAPSIEHSKHATLPVHVPAHVEKFMDIFRRAVDQEQQELEEINIGGGRETDDDIDNDDNANGDDDDDDESGLDRDAHHDILFRPPHQTDPRNRPVTPRRPMPKMSAQKGHLAIGQTPAHRRLRTALQAVTPLRPLLKESKSYSPGSIPKPIYVRPTTEIHYTSLPRAARDVHDENEMLREELRKAKVRDEEQMACLEFAHAQLAILGMYTETCRKRAAAASKKAKGGKGRRVNGTGFARIVTDAQLLEELERMDEDAKRLEREKEARREARNAKSAAAEHHKSFMAARREAWEAVKAEHVMAMAKWGEEGWNGKKPQRLRQQEVYIELGIDNEDHWVEE